LPLPVKARSYRAFTAFDRLLGASLDSPNNETAPGGSGAKEKAVYSTQWIKRVAATLTVGVLLAVAFAGAAQAGNGTPKGMTAQEWKALVARSEAMNRYYHLGAFSKSGTAVRQAEERRAQAVNQYYDLSTNSKAAAAVQEAEERRAQAMNRYYNLGTSGGAAAHRADVRRAQAVNRYFHLGSYAVIGESSGFDWTDAGIGAGAMLGAIILVGGLAVEAHRRTTGKSFPSTT
jgi:hypothetical protein